MPFWLGWRQVIACMMLQAVGAATIASAYSVVAIPLAQEFHPSRMVLMLAMTVMSLVSAVLSPWLGERMDRSSLKLVMALGTAFLVTGYAALSFATSFTQVLVIYGLFMAPANVLAGPMSASVLVSRWFVKRRGAALGLAISGVALGAFVFPPVIQWLLQVTEWRSAFRIMAIAIALMMFPMTAIIVNRPADRGLFPDGVPAELGPAAGAMQERVGAKQILADPTFWMLALAVSVVLAGMKGMVTNLVPLALDGGIAAQSAALLISVFAAAGFIAKLGFVALSDQTGPRWIILASLSGFAVGMACLVRAQDGYAMIALGVGLVGFFGGLMVPLQGLVIAGFYGERSMGKAMGLLNLVVLIGLLLAPPLYGRVYDLTGKYDGAFLVTAILAMACTLLIPKIRTGLNPASTADRNPEVGATMASLKTNMSK